MNIKINKESFEKQIKDLKYELLGSTKRFHEIETEFDTKLAQIMDDVNSKEKNCISKFTFKIM